MREREREIEILFATLRKEYKLGMFQNEVLREVCGSKKE
jgi:hypothetical protein